jgi:prepilin-type N-terminal cleavage/methylation domain-containing protein
LATRRQRGFTLIEVLVAFVLLSLVLATSFELFTTGMRRAVDLEERSRALAVAQARMASAGVESPLKEGSTATPYGLYRIETVVTWRGADERDQSFSLATLELGSIL